MSKSEKVAKSAAIVIAFTIISKILGFVREQLIAARFGSTSTTDAYFMALSAISLFNVMITNTLNQTTIPVLSTVETNEGTQAKYRHTNNLLNIAIIFSILLIIAAFLLTPLLLKILAPGFRDEQYTMTVIMTRIGLGALLVSSVIGVFRGYLQSEMMFTESAASLLPFNLVFITYLLFFAGYFDIKMLMAINVAASASMILVQIPGLRSTGYRYKPVFDLKDDYIKQVAVLAPPVLISSIINDVNALVDKSMASFLTVGSISALTYADRIKGLVTTIFIATVVTVMFPILSQEAVKEKLDGLKNAIVRGFNVLLLLTIPSTVGLIILAQPIVKVIFERRAFDEQATYMTAGALVFYAIGLVGISFNAILQRSFYAMKDAKTPMINALVTVLANVVLNFAFVFTLQHRGLALATSLASVASSIFLFIKLKKNIGPVGMTSSLICGAKSLLASLIMGGAVYLSHQFLLPRFSQGTLGRAIPLFISIALGVLVYLIAIHFLRVPEMQWFLKTVKKKLGR